MPYTRWSRRFYLTPPKLLTFIISLVLAVIALVAVYGHFSALHSINGFVTLLIAWLVLVAGVLIRGI
jgi:purine-cytosine permease-like protein